MHPLLPSRICNCGTLTGFRKLALNLKDDGARQAIRQLACKADVVVQNFRPGVMERLGYGYGELSAINPRIVYCSGSGYGETGPYAGRPGQDMLLQGLTGLMAATGSADGPPVPVGAGFADQIGAMNMAYGILAALLWRERSGKGQEIKVDLLSGMLAHQSQEMVMALNTGKDFERPHSGIGHAGMDAPFGVYPAADGWVTIAMSPFRTLVDVLGDDSLLAYDDPRTLFDKRDEIWRKIAGLTEKWLTAELIAKLLAADVWCGEVKTHLQAASDPQVKHMECIASYEHPVAGTVKVVAPAVRFSATPARISRPAPLVGEHTREVLGEHGFAPAQIDRLIEQGSASEPTG